MQLAVVSTLSPFGVGGYDINKSNDLAESFFVFLQNKTAL